MDGSGPRRTTLTTALESIVASRSFRPELHPLVLRSHPSLVTALALNPLLDEQHWRSLYTLRPKVELVRALHLVSRPLTAEQLDHMRTEKRSQVWAAVMSTTVLDHDLVSSLAREGRLDSRIPVTPTAPPWYGCSTLLTERAASRTVLRDLHPQDPDLEPACEYVLEHLGLDEPSWDALITLAPSFSGSLSTLVSTSRALR